MIKKILNEKNPLLRQISKELTESEILKKEISLIINIMKETLAQKKEGIALSACQIGIMKRIFIVSGKYFPELNEGEDIIFINPSIVRKSKKCKLLEEGCLSIPDKIGLVKRSEKITIRAKNLRNEEKEWSAEKLLAQVFQHEIDHLNGVLFTDIANQIWKIDNEIKNNERN